MNILGDVRIINNTEVQDHIIQLGKNKDNIELLNRIENIRNISTVEAKYHKNCLRKLELPGTGRFSGEREETIQVINYISNYLDANKEECQFSLDEILADFKGDKPSQKWILTKLKEKYGNDVIITSLKNRSPIISFRDTGHEILYNTWYEKREKKMENERLRLVKSAGEIIVEDIRSKIYFREEYPSPMKFLDNADDDVPESLQALLETIILKNKRGDLDKWRVIITAIAHAIISATRPRSFVSSILTALSTFLLKRYGSSTLLDMLSALGFAASYKEARLFEISCILHPCIQNTQSGFVQFVFDNVDHQTCTLTGTDTLHAMAGIQCITPAEENLFTSTIRRLEKIPKSVDIGQYGRVDLLLFHKVKPGLASIVVENLQDINPLTSTINVNSIDCMWFYEKWKFSEKTPGLFNFETDIN